jgi:hypothetical protein
VVVSLSSFPGRAEYMPPTVHSIMHGKLQPDKMYIWIPRVVQRLPETTAAGPAEREAAGAATRKMATEDADETSYVEDEEDDIDQAAKARSATPPAPDLPAEAVALREHYGDHVVAVQAPSYDYGPATKLIPTLLEETDPDTIIVTVDDDVVYHPDVLQDMVEGMMQYPDFTVVRSCEETALDRDGK